MVPYWFVFLFFDYSTIWGIIKINVLALYSDKIFYKCLQFASDGFGTEECSEAVFHMIDGKET